MKKRVEAVVCAAVVVTAIAMPFASKSMPDSSEAVRVEVPSEVVSSVDADLPLSDSSVDGNHGEADEVEAAQVVRADSGMEYEAGTLLVGLQDGATLDELNARLPHLDYIATKRVNDDDVALGYVELELADGVDVEDARQRIADDNPSIVTAAQPNYIYHLLDDSVATPTSSASLLSGIVTQATTTIDDPDSKRQWALDAVNAYDAWDIVRAGDVDDQKDRVTVAVLDNGCLTSHEDLKNNIVATFNAVKDAVDDTDVRPEFDGHGTHVCGIVSAEANNGKGVAGVSYNAGILPIEVFEWCKNPETGEWYAGASSSTLCNAYSYICNNWDDKNIRVANMSLGISQSSDSIDGDDRALVRAVSAAASKGVLTVCAAGNEAEEKGGAYYNFPSDWLDGALGVISSTSAGKRASYSNYNVTGQTSKEITAPGSGILSTYSNSSSSYNTLDGTSMASPYVAGIAALVFTANSDLTPGEAADILCSTAKDINTTGWDQATGYGLVNASKAVAAAKATATSGWSASYVPKKVISYATATLSATKYTYDGAEKTPGVEVELDGKKLTKDADYAVSYSNNTNAGTGKVTITGIGDYTGMITKTFTISPRSVTPTFSLSASAYTWDNKVKKPGVTVKAKIGTKTYTLKNGTDYSVEYASGLKNVGAYKVTITRKGGNFTFSKKTLTFKINPKAATIVAPMALKKGLTAKWKKQATKMSSSVIAGYRVQLATNKTFTKNKKYVTVKGYKNVAKKITGLKAKTTYYVRVQTYQTVGGTPYYSSWSGVKSVKTKA